MKKKMVRIGLGVFMGAEPGQGLTKELPENAKVSPCPKCGEEAADKGTFEISLERSISREKTHLVVFGRCRKCGHSGPYLH
jgi:predicted RNA-binding Zn-ribbon protein involved in translation (DUF1610 family)